ncbi:Pleckstrin y-like domain family B member 2 [Liparis tanakae]|uniref:Pleckstrin y-like domain family B member 2 n=1 Tax=Liparis tanakae TaxID=230148 RepID=A0A4Z2GD07_9TELE|nr:Pleckstrin y-like domain family B member 2 [Liparis tanakae]
MNSMFPQRSAVATLGYSSDCVKSGGGGSSVGESLLRGSRSKAELQDLMETLQRRKSALEASLRAAECSRRYLSVPPSPAGSQPARPLSILGNADRPPPASRSPSYASGGSVPPSPRQGERQPSSNGFLRHSHARHQSQDSLVQDSPVLSYALQPPPRSPRVKSGAASVPSSPRMSRRLYSQSKAGGDAARQRKYSTGSLTSLGMHSRSLPRLHNAAEPPALSLPSPRHSAGSHRGSAGQRRSLSSLEQPPDVTVPASMPGTPRRSSLISLSSLGVEMDGTGLDLGFGEGRLSFGKGGLSPGQRECQRLETILNLCTEFGHVEREPAGSAASDLQKINKELEKLQVSDDESVFSDSPGGGGAPEIKARDFQRGEEQPAGQRQQSVYREARSSSPAVSLGSSAAASPSSRHRAKVSSSTRSGRSGEDIG